jgi:hypothetical protein
MDYLIAELIKLIVRLFTGDGAKKPPAIQPPPPMSDRPQSLPDAPRRMQQAPRPMQGAPSPLQRTRANVVGRPPASRRAPARVPAAPPIQQVIQAAVQTAPPPARVSRPHSAGIDAATLRRWLRPQVLRNQFILSEIFQPPIALRDWDGA